MQELEVTWGRTLSVWWLIWRWTAGGLILAGLIGVAQAGLEMSAASPEVAKWLPSVVASILDAIWFVIVVRMALRKHCREFRIALLPRV